MQSSECNRAETKMIAVAVIFAVLTAITSSQDEFNKQQTLGKYCGMLEESVDPAKTRVYNCRGAVWALDEHRLYITGFTFQPSIYNQENITFWIGPATALTRFADEMVPSDNGLYLEPQEIPLKSVLFHEGKRQAAKKPRGEQLASVFSLIGSSGKRRKSNSSQLVAKSPKPEPTGNDTASEKKRKEFQRSKRAPVPEPEPGQRKRAKDTSGSTQVTTVLPITTSTILWQNDTSLQLPFNNSQDDQYLNRSVRNSTVDERSENTSIGLLEEGADRREIELIVGGGVTIKVTRSRLMNMTLIPLLNYTEEYTTSPYFDDVNTTLDWERHDWNTTKSTTQEVETTTAKKVIKLKALTWYAGAQPLILEIPTGRQLSEFRWLSVWDHLKKIPIATLLFPSGPGFSIPRPYVLNGFKPLLSKDVHSGPIEIVDTKTIRVHNFTFEGDAPGAWFYVGRSLIPVASGEIIPIYRQNGTFDCDFLGAYDNTTLTLKLPGSMEVTDIFWLSVFCLPYGISFAHIYLPYKDLNVPAAMDFETVPQCMLEE